MLTNYELDISTPPQLKIQSNLYHAYKSPVKTEIISKKINSFDANFKSNSLHCVDREKILIYSLVDDFLKTNLLKYTESVFAPESGYSLSLMTRNEIANAFNIGSNIQNLSILEILINYGHIAPKSLTENQNNQDEICKMKIKQVEEKWAQELSDTKAKLALFSDERLIEYKKEIDLKMKDTLNYEIQKFKDYEIEKIKNEEALKYKNEIKHLQEDFYREKEAIVQKMIEEKEQMMTQYSLKLKESENILAEERTKSSLTINEIKIREEKVKSESIVSIKEVKEKMKRIDEREHEILNKMNELNQIKIQEQNRLHMEFEEYKLCYKNEMEEELRKMNEAKFELNSYF